MAQASQLRHQAQWRPGPPSAVLLVDVMVTTGGGRNTRVLRLGCPVSTLSLRAPPRKRTPTCSPPVGEGLSTLEGRKSELV